MKEYIEIGCVPFDEDCAQVGQENYIRNSQIECIVFKKQIVRMLKDQILHMPAFDNLCTKTFQHDFGSYRELVIYYDPSNEAQTAFAFWLEGEATSISDWDSQSKIELVQMGYTLPIR